MTESNLRNILWTDEQIAFIDEARGDRPFSEYVKTEILKVAGRKLRRKPPAVRGRGRPPKKPD